MRNTMKASTRQSGSALLIILLLLSAIGAIILTASRAIIETSRGSTSGITLQTANQMAQAGIYEGLNRLKVGGSALVNGEYGNGMLTNPGLDYSLAALSRGYSDAACTQLSSDGPLDA